MLEYYWKPRREVLQKADGILTTSSLAIRNAVHKHIQPEIILKDEDTSASRQIIYAIAGVCDPSHGYILTGDPK